MKTIYSNGVVRVANGVLIMSEPAIVRVSGAKRAIILGDWRARVYLEGGIEFDRFLPGIGWVVADDADDVPPLLESLSAHMRDSIREQEKATRASG